MFYLFITFRQNSEILEINFNGCNLFVLVGLASAYLWLKVFFFFFFFVFQTKIRQKELAFLIKYCEKLQTEFYRYVIFEAIS